MKTQIIQLDPHDDKASVRDKIIWSKAERLVLVWPGRNRILTSRLDLKMVQRYARHRNAQIGLVTLDPDVRVNASALEIPVVDDLSSLDQMPWPEEPDPSAPLLRSERTSIDELGTRIERARPRRGRSLPQAVRVLIFSAAVLSIITAAAILLPSAELVIDPPRTQEERTMHLPLPADPSDTDSETNHSPLREDQVRVAGTIRITTTGSKLEPGEYASGEVEFTNLDAEVVIVPAGTTVRVPGDQELYFVTQSRLSLPADTGVSRTASVVASIPGTRGNVPAGDISSIDGDLGLQVSISNPEPVRGGTVISQAAVTASDLEVARAELRQELIDEAEQILLASLGSDEELIQGSLGVAEVRSEQFDRQVGEIADTIHLELEIIVEALFVNVERLASELHAEIQTDTSLTYQLVPGSLELQSIVLAERSSSDQYSLVIGSRYALFRSIDKGNLSTIIRGVKPDEAARRIELAYPRVDYSLSVRPAWYPAIPLLPQQIDIRYAWEASP